MQSPLLTSLQRLILQVARAGCRIFDHLRGFGVAGMLAYGLLNSAYYSLAFLTLWWVPTSPYSTLLPANCES